MGCEILVTEIEMIVTKEATIGTEGTGVSRAQDTMLVLVDESRLLAGRSSPEEEDETLALAAEGGDDGIGKLLPALSAVTEGLVSTHAEAGVEQEHTLIGPASQVVWPLAGVAEGCLLVKAFSLYLLHDVDKRGWRGDVLRYAEAQAVRLSRFVVRVLAQDDYLDLVERCRVEGVEDKATGRIAWACRILRLDELDEFLEVRLLKFFL